MAVCLVLNTPGCVHAATPRIERARRGLPAPRASRREWPADRPQRSGKILTVVHYSPNLSRVSSGRQWKLAFMHWTCQLENCIAGKWEKGIHVQDRRHVDTLATARALQASRKIQDERERDIAQLPITLERMVLFYT